MSAVLKPTLPGSLPRADGRREIYYPESDGQPMAETDLHRDLMIDLIKGLDRYFGDRTDVYTTGNILFYFTEGEIEDCVSPDVMVVFGVPRGERRVYKLWEEDVPAVVIELASRKTLSKDRNEKYLLYEMLGVQEYFIYNPEAIRGASLVGYRLAASKQYELLPVVDNRVTSKALGLELVHTGKVLRLFDPKTNKFVPTVNKLGDQNKELSQTNQELSQTNQELSSENLELKARLAELEVLLKRQT